MYGINRQPGTEEESSVIMNKISKMKQKANWKNMKIAAVQDTVKWANLCAVGVTEKKGRGNKKYLKKNGRKFPILIKTFNSDSRSSMY